MNAKQFLHRHFALDRQIKCVQLEIQEMELRATAIGSFDYSGVKVVSSPDPGARYEDVVAELVELKNKLKEMNIRSMQEMIRIEDVIASVPNEYQRDVLRLRYVVHMKFSDIAETLNYSEQNVYVLHRKGLKWVRDNYVSEL